VGGHCIGVDPYYLTYKSQMLGYHPEVILAGRRINDNMGHYIAQQTIKRMIAANRLVKGGRVLVLGLTFKENCADLRNSRVVDVLREIESFGAVPVVWDPVADSAEARYHYQLELVSPESLERIDAVVAAVAHRAIVEMDLTRLSRRSVPGTPFIDVKSAFDRAARWRQSASMYGDCDTGLS
jgi:UDP-N-acetyl-D-galactosamine dehydrogenase